MKCTSHVCDSAHMSISRSVNITNLVSIQLGFIQRLEENSNDYCILITKKESKESKKRKYFNNIHGCGLCKNPHHTVNPEGSSPIMFSNAIQKAAYIITRSVSMYRIHTWRVTCSSEPVMFKFQWIDRFLVIHLSADALHFSITMIGKFQGSGTAH